MKLSTLYRIAEDLTSGQEPPHMVFARYGIDVRTASAIASLPEFVSYVKALQGEEELTEFIRRKSRAELVEVLSSLTDIASDNGAEPKARVAAVKMLSEIADVGPKPQQNNLLPMASITIQFSDTSKTIEATPDRAVDHAEIVSDEGGR